MLILIEPQNSVKNNCSQSHTCKLGKICLKKPNFNIKFETQSNKILYTIFLSFEVNIKIHYKSMVSL